MGNNPVMMADVDGGEAKDWYKPIGGGKAKWFDGSGPIAGFEWLGGADFTFGQIQLPEINVWDKHLKWDPAYMPWMGPDAYAIQGSLTLNTTFAEVNLSGGIAFDNYQIGVYGDVSGSVGVDLTRMMPSLGGGLGISFFNRNNENVPINLEDAISGPSHTRTLIIPGLTISVSKPVQYDLNKRIIHAFGYDQYSIGLGGGLGYNEALSTSYGTVFTIHEQHRK